MLRAALLLVVSLVLSVSVAQAQATASVSFTVTSGAVWLRAAPSALGARLLPVPLGATAPTLARTADAGWVLVDLGEVRGWLPAGFGELAPEGSLSHLPVVAARTASIDLPRNTNRSPLPTWIHVPPKSLEKLRRFVRAGRSPRMFTVAGDSNSTWQRSIGQVAAGTFDLSDASLRPVVARFDPAFVHRSIAVGGGFRTADMLAPPQPPIADCPPEEARFACELRRSNASIVFVQLGTGDRFDWHNFEGNLTALIEMALASNVLPVLVTKADDLESYQGGASIGYINDTIRALAARHEVPLVDFYIATRDLPAVPNPALPHRPFTQYGLHDEWGYYFHLTEEGFALRVQATLRMLDALTRGW